MNESAPTGTAVNETKPAVEIAASAGTIPPAPIAPPVVVPTAPQSGVMPPHSKKRSPSFAAHGSTLPGQPGAAPEKALVWKIQQAVGLKADVIAQVKACAGMSEPMKAAIVEMINGHPGTAIFLDGHCWSANGKIVVDIDISPNF